MDEIYELLQKIKQNRLEYRQVGNSKKKTNEELNQEYAFLLGEYHRKVENTDNEWHKRYEFQLGEIIAEFSAENNLKNGINIDFMQALNYDKTQLTELLNNYINIKNTNSERTAYELSYCDGMINYYINDIKTHPYGQEFLKEYMLRYSKIHEILQNDNSLEQKSDAQSSSSVGFNGQRFNNNSFLSELNKCQTETEVRSLVDKTVNSFKIENNIPEIIGSSGNPFSKTAYSNDGIFTGFIYPETKISNATTGFSYRIYDKDYLYSFALGIKKMNLSEDNANLFQYIMPFLDSYFGFPKDNIDRRDDVLYNYAINNAEKFYQEHNIPISEEMGAVDQMQLSGDFPLSALKGQNVAQCVERGALAQNILKMCGYNSYIMFGDAESKGHSEGHCWNTILDENNNALLIDFSNTVYSYKNGTFNKRIPYSFEINFIDFFEILDKGNAMESKNYHYEDGKKVYESSVRKYLPGKTLEILDKITSQNLH